MSSTHTLRWISLSLLVLGCVAGISGFFSSKQVLCTLEEERGCPAELDQLILTLTNRSLFLTDFQTEISAYTRESSFSLARLEKQLPNQLHLIFRQDPAVYYVIYQENMYAVAESGFVLNSGQDLSKPPTGITVRVLQSSEELGKGVIPAAFHQPLLLLAQNIGRANLQPSEVVWISSQEIRLTFADATFGLIDASSPDTAIFSLKRILESNEFQLARKESEGSIEIDLRLKLPVLRRVQ